MNTPHNSDHNAPDGHNDFPDALRWQLRALRQEVEPAHDLWPGIAARLSVQQPTVAARPPRRWLAPAALSTGALAASLLLVVGTVGWFARAPEQLAAPEGPTLVQREADGMTRQYLAALQEMQAAPMSTSLQPTIEELDRDAAMIRDALARDPDSVLLLEQLRRTYAHRLALAQRAAYT